MEPSWNDLERRKVTLLSRCLAVNTHKTYNTGIRQYHQFCQKVRVPTLPLSENTLENFSMSLSTRVGYKTIKTYLCGVQFWSKIQGDRVLIKNMERLKYILSGIRREQGTDFDKPTRPAVTDTNTTHRHGTNNARAQH